MKSLYLVDTDWVIHYLNGHQQVVEKLSSFRKEGFALSIISLAELYEGVHYSSDPAGNENDLKDFLTGVQILEPDEDICKIFGKERGRLRKQKKMISDFDLLIASTCLRYQLTILTNNQRHYQMVEDLNIFSLP